MASLNSNAGLSDTGCPCYYRKLVRELSFFSWTRGPGKMQVGSFLKILKNKGAKFSGISYFGGHF